MVETGVMPLKRSSCWTIATSAAYIQPPLGLLLPASQLPQPLLFITSLLMLAGWRSGACVTSSDSARRDHRSPRILLRDHYTPLSGGETFRWRRSRQHCRGVAASISTSSNSIVSSITGISPQSSHLPIGAPICTTHSRQQTAVPRITLNEASQSRCRCPR